MRNNFRLRLGGGVALRLRSRRLSACAALFPLADRRPKPRQTIRRFVAFQHIQYNQTVPKLTAQDFHRRYAPKKCDLRIFLRERGVNLAATWAVFEWLRAKAS
jgi:hypothetical protein